MYLTLNPSVLKNVLSQCDKQEIVFHAKRIKAILMEKPNRLTFNQRRALFEAFKHCKKLYSKT